MREIVFRGKRVDNGEWIVSTTVSRFDKYLYMCKSSKCEVTYDLYNITAIISKKPFFVEVIPETVGQYTGLTDKNGTKIFEGDIVEHTVSFNGSIRTGYIEYIERYGAFFIRGSGYSDNQMYAFCNFKVIGNIHDNPELLEEN